jgi:diphthine-ammonia ligase
VTGAVATWSGGKDSCLAAHYAILAGYDVRFLANTVARDSGRVRFHGILADVIRLQSKAVARPLLQQETDPDTYEREFKDNVRRGLGDGVTSVVFGDIHLQHCLEWATRVCDELGVDLVEPLFGRDPKQVLADFIGAGFEAIVVSTQADLLGKDWVGRRIDGTFLDDIVARPDVDPCGENGEYHSLVLDGPLFSQRLEIAEAEPVLLGGYWFLDIRDYGLASQTMIRSVSGG